MKRVLTIAGSDSGGGAGVQADLKTFAARGVYGASAITAVTAQNTTGVLGVHELPTEFVVLQIDAVMQDIGADAWKTGMLANEAIVCAVAERARYYGVQNLVVDPVMVAKSGDRLLAPQAEQALVRTLLPLARVVTPNLPEAETLLGSPIRDRDAMRQAARTIASMGARSVVIKGGHLEETTDAVDLLYDEGEFLELRGPRVQTPNTHGTGCTFAAAIAAELAKGSSVREAARAAKDYVAAALRSGSRLRIGSGHGPLDHFPPQAR